MLARWLFMKSWVLNPICTATRLRSTVFGRSRITTALGFTWFLFLDPYHKGVDLVPRLAGFLRRWLPADPHLWIAFVAAAVFLLTEILHWLPWFHVSEVSEMGVLIVIMISILTLVADRLKEADQNRENTERLGRVADYVSDLQGVSLRTRPSTPEEYESLWGGFTGNYYVYNPAYRVDEDTGEQEIVSILARRYQDPRFRKAQYLFLTKRSEEHTSELQ